MADIIKTQGESVPSQMRSKWKDMGDGTHALQRSVVVDGGAVDADLQVGGADVTNANPVPVSDAGQSLTVDQATHDNLNLNANLQVANADNALANPAFAQLTAGEAHFGEVGGNSGPIRTTFTRPNDILAYIAKDALNSSVGAPVIITFTNVGRKVGGTGYITKVRLMTSQSTNTARYRLHLYSVAPAALADNVPFTLLIANWANRIGYVDLDAMGTEGAGSDCAISQNTDIRLQFACAAADRNLYGQFETLDIFTPAANQVYNIELGVEAN